LWRQGEDFFLSGRSIPSWIAGLAFISANLGAQEVIGMPLTTDVDKPYKLWKK
jgi:Na+/proline symporter